MTLVAVLYADTSPIVVADSLISNFDGLPDGLNTPLFSTPDSRAAGEYRPAGLARKFWMLPDRSLFFYAGAAGAARQLFDYLVEIVSIDCPYDREIHRTAQDYLQRIRSRFSFLIVVPSEDEAQLWAYGNVHRADIPNYGHVAMLGSGVEEALEILRRYPGSP